jgi:hypothetical protein
MLIAGCTPDDERLHGSWRSDADGSMEWNRKNCHLTERQDSGLSQRLGHMTVTYNPGGTGSITMEPYTLVVGSNKRVMHGFTNSANFRIASRKDDMVTLKVTQKTTSGVLPEYICTVHFDGPDTYWMFLIEDQPETSAREYFKRTNGPNK